MDHKLQMVFALIAAICILLPVAELTGEPETCQDLFNADNYQSITSQLKVLANCSEDDVRSLEAEKQSEILGMLNAAAGRLRSIHLKGCQNIQPRNCSFPMIPKNGGLICVTHEKTRYCKPMCDQGYDFVFLRLSRLFESCGEGSGYKWSSQYLGGKRLAVCSESTTKISGQNSTYFPQTCLDAMYNHTQERALISIFKDELKKIGVDKIKSKCLLCGN
ncbi:uncharacterized protein LOC144480340 [Mustelus asterias]